MKNCFQNIKKNKAGFTLIELLVVISIIALLAGIVLTSISTSRKRARDAKRIADISQLSKGFELFFNTNFVYPTGTTAVGTGYTTLGVGALLGSDVLQAVNSSGTLAFTPTYMVKIPTAPVPADNVDTSVCTSANNQYMLETNAIGTNYTVTFCLGSNLSGNSILAGIHYLTNGGVK